MHRQAHAAGRARVEGRKGRHCSRRRRFAIAWALGAAAAMIVVSACRGPLRSGESDRLSQALAASIARELAALPEPASAATQPAVPPLPPLTQPQSPVLQTLEGRLEELESLGPLGDGRADAVTLGPDLAGHEQQRAGITLDQAVQAAVRHNLGVQQSRLQPAITAQDVTIAEAVFDWVLFGSASLSRFDEPQRVPVLGGVPLGTPISRNETHQFETGIRRRFWPGTEVAVSTDLTRFRNRSPGISFSPDPAYTAAARLSVNQPLLRGFGRDVNTATILLSRNDLERTIQQVEIDLLDVVDDAEAAFWDLAFAWRDLAIAEWLVEAGVDVRGVLERRQEFDTRPAQFADAVARVEQRQAEVLRARRRVRAASDRLKAIMNDPQLPVTSESIVYPLTEPVGSAVTYSLREAILTALDHRPELEQAGLDVDSAGIRITVARNQRLPLLDLSAQMALVGLDDSAEGAYSEAAEADFVDYVLALLFEYPLGNRASEAALRQARLQRSAAIIAYQRAVQTIIVDVKSALRDVITNYELIAATRSFRIAQAENLRTLLVEEQTLAGLTPEFLNLKFQRQETLASARREEVQALVNFDKSISALYRAMGIGLTMKNLEVEVIDEAEAADAPLRLAPIEAAEYERRTDDHGEHG